MIELCARARKMYLLPSTGVQCGFGFIFRQLLAIRVGKPFNFTVCLWEQKMFPRIP